MFLSYPIGAKRRAGAMNGQKSDPGPKETPRHQSTQYNLGSVILESNILNHI